MNEFCDILGPVLRHVLSYGPEAFKGASYVPRTGLLHSCVLGCLVNRCIKKTFKSRKRVKKMYIYIYISIIWHCRVQWDVVALAVVWLFVTSMSTVTSNVSVLQKTFLSVQAQVNLAPNICSFLGCTKMWHTLYYCANGLNLLVRFIMQFCLCKRESFHS